MSNKIPNLEIYHNSHKAKWAQRLIWTVMVVDLISLFSSYFQYELLILVQNEELVTEEMVNANDLREQVIGVLYMLIYFTSAVFYIRWFKSCYSNLGKRTVTNEKESMAIWGWIIPIISLFKPYQMMKEMWTDTSLKIRLKEPSYKEKATTIIGFWWFLWLVTNVIGNYIFKFAFKSETVQDYINLTLSEMVLSVLSIPLAVLAYIIIEEYNDIEAKLASLESEENTTNQYAD